MNFGCYTWVCPGHALKIENTHCNRWNNYVFLEISGWQKTSENVTIFYNFICTTMYCLGIIAWLFSEVQNTCASYKKLQFSPNYLFLFGLCRDFTFITHPMPKWWTLVSHFLDFDIFTGCHYPLNYGYSQLYERRIIRT